MSNLDAYREAGNPMFNENKLKLGIFGPNCSNACAMTLAETSFEPTFEKNVEIAGLLEAAGFECISADCALARLWRAKQFQRP